MKILFATNSVRYFFNHRFSLASALLEQGCDVCCIANEDGIESHFQSQKKVKLIYWNIKRKSFNPLREIISFLQLFFVIKKESPCLVHSITIKSVIYAGLVCRLMNIPMVALIPGRGTAFTQNGFKGIILKNIATFLYKISLNNKKFRVCFENEFDRESFIKDGIVDRALTRRIMGSGVDINKFQFHPRDFSKPSCKIVLMASRLLKDKGVLEYFEAAKIISQKRNDILFLLAGEIDSDNLTSFSAQEFLKLLHNSFVNYIGFQKDMVRLLEKTHIFCLPSYHEGLPVSVLEALSSGAIVVTSDIPGCRDAVLDGSIGYLAEVRNPQDLAEKIEEVADCDVYPEMGFEARKIVEEIFSTDKINRVYLNIYEELLQKDNRKEHSICSIL